MKTLNHKALEDSRVTGRAFKLFVLLLVCGLVFVLASCNTSMLPVEEPTIEEVTSKPKDEPVETDIPPSVTTCTITALPSELLLDAFYTKHCVVRGIPIIAAAEVPNDALVQAWSVMNNMLEGVSEQVIQKMITTRTRVGIIGVNQQLTDMPEYRTLDRDWPLPNGLSWNERARGLGATLDRPLSTGAEENILCYSQDTYKGQNILVHEFAHTVLIMGVELVDTSFHNRLNAAYQSALAKGLWLNTYAAETVDEYWAVGVQNYYNTNLEASPANGIYNEINTRVELEAYDPALFALVQEVFGVRDWTATCPEFVEGSV